MITRRRTNTPPNESLQQASITGAGGIDITRPITANNVADKTVNLDLDYDGSLVLRKPLIVKDSFNWLLNSENESIILVKYMYNKTHRLIIIKDTSEVIPKYKLVILSQDLSWEVYCIRFTDINNTPVDKTLPNEYTDIAFPFWNLSNPKVFNTNTSTIIGNCTIDLTNIMFAEELDPNDEVIHEAIYNPFLFETAYAKNAPRYLQIFYETTSEKWVVRIVTPEINNLATSETIILNPNTTLDAAYALRDNYNASLPSVKGVLAYAGVTFQNNKLVFNPDMKTTNFESDTNESINNVPNPQYWNPYTYNINNAQLTGFHNSTGFPREPRIKWVFGNNKIPRNAIKDISFTFQTNGKIRVWNGGTPIPVFQDVSATASSIITGTFASGFVEDVTTRFLYNRRFSNYTNAITDVVESGESFLNACISYNGSISKDFHNVAGTGLSFESWWQNCGFKATLKVTLKNDTFKEFELQYGQIW